MPYIVTLDNAGRRDLANLEHSISARVSEAIDRLVNEPRPRGCTKIVGTKLRYRVRAGDYRIIYDVYDQSRSVVVRMIRHRGDAYR